MAFLYEKSKLWRTYVHKTGNRGILYGSGVVVSFEFLIDCAALGRVSPVTCVLFTVHRDRHGIWDAWT